MIIANDKSHKEKLEMLGLRYLGRPLVSESLIDDFIRTLRIEDLDIFASRMQVILDSTSPLVESATDQIDETGLRLIKQVAAESKDKGYRQIVGAIIKALEQGGAGIKSARKTASVAVDMVFLWTPGYFAALKEYQSWLREIRRNAKANGSRK
jgi:hypothetical protein